MNGQCYADKSTFGSGDHGSGVATGAYWSSSDDSGLSRATAPLLFPAFPLPHRPPRPGREQEHPLVLVTPSLLSACEDASDEFYVRYYTGQKQRTVYSNPTRGASSSTTTPPTTTTINHRTSHTPRSRSSSTDRRRSSSSPRYSHAPPSAPPLPPEFMEFEILPNGKLRYANNSNCVPSSCGSHHPATVHRHDEGMIRREVFLSPGVMEEIKSMILTSGIFHVDDSNWPQEEDTIQMESEGSGARTNPPPPLVRQEMECRLGCLHLALTTTTTMNTMLGSRGRSKSYSPAEQIRQDGLRTFYFLTQDLKALILALISAHFKARPFG